MLDTVKVRKSGNSLMFPITKELRAVTNIVEGDSFVVEVTPTGFVANKVNHRTPELVLPMTYDELIKDAKPDSEALLPLEDMHLD